MPVVEGLLYLAGAVMLVGGLLLLSEWERRMRRNRDTDTYWADRHRTQEVVRGAPVARVTLKPRLVPMPDWVPKGDDSRSN